MSDEEVIPTALRHTAQMVLDARREWAEAQEQLESAQRAHYIYGTKLVGEMEAHGITDMVVDGVAIHCDPNDDQDVVFDPDPLAGLGDDDD